ncbi:MAG: autotransporter outer membrane beta-barrel domain-containing protein [Elusimicrobiota bacterium]|jgi:outer membrane autotransporter protein|nr:autotransporter outer membrane beta-barrel domain-containing protein [Elusimicrobiota bacterium]
MKKILSLPFPQKREYKLSLMPLRAAGAAILGYLLIAASAAALNAQGFAARQADAVPYLNNAILKTATNSLNKRLGDLRRTAPDANYAFWGRGFYSDYSRGGDFLNADIFGFETGVDTRLFKNNEDRFYVGISGGYISANDFEINKTPAGKSYAPSAGIYAAWLNKNGWFLDLTARNLFYKTELTRPADWNMSAASLEFGKEFKFDIGQTSYFALEPKVKGVYGITSAEMADFNGYQIKYSAHKSAFARAALFAGYSKTLSNCAAAEPYIEGGYNGDFSQKAKASGNGAEQEYDFAGGSFDIGGGINITATDIISLYSYAGYEKGNDIKNFTANAGFRLSFDGKRTGCRCCRASLCKEEQGVNNDETATRPQTAPIIAPAAQTFNIIYFDFDKYNIKPQYEKEIENLSQQIKNSGKTYEVQGYSDIVGPAEYNQKLSERRAKAVYDDLIELGVPQDKLTHKGYGKTHFANPAHTKEANAENRRVEIKPLT